MDLRKALGRFVRETEEKHVESLDRLSQKNGDLSAKKEEQDVWVGPYPDITYTWGRLSGAQSIDMVLFLVSIAVLMLLAEIIRQTQGPW